MARLSDEQRAEIRAAYAAEEGGYGTLAKRFGVDRKTVQRIVKQADDDRSVQNEGDGGVASIAEALNPFKKREGEAKPKRERAPRSTGGPKRSLATGLGTVYGAAGAVVEMRGVSFRGDDGKTYWSPALAGKIMQINQEAAGRHLSDWAKSHEVIYRILEPVFGAKEFDLLAKVVAPPLMVHMMQTRPHLAPVLQPYLLPMLRDIYVEFKRNEKQMREMMEKLSESGDVSAAEEFWEFAGAFGIAKPTIVPDQVVREAPGAASEGEEVSPGETTRSEPPASI